MLAETIKNLCVKNERFLTELAEASFVPAPETVTNVKLEVFEEIVENDEMDYDDFPDGEVYTDVVERPITPIEMEILEQPQSPESNKAFNWEPYMKINEKSKAIKRQRKTSFFCTYCFKEFNTRAKCLYHEKVKHMPKPANDNERPFTCDRCGLK